MRGLGVLALLLMACARPPGVELGPPYAPEAPTGTVRVVVAGMRSPKGAEPYRVLFQGLGAWLGVQVEVFGRRTYGEVLEALRQGRADLGFLCTLAAGLGAEEGVLGVLLAGETSVPYQSLVVVQVSSSYRTLADLRGLPFAFTDPLSNTGHAWPKLAARGLGEGFFAQAFFAYHHDRVLLAVLHGMAEGAAVDRVVYETLGLPGLRVVWQGPTDPPPPVVARKGLDPALRDRFLKGLLAYASTPEGRRVLQPLGLEGFRPVETLDYVRVYRRAKEALE